jgi:hypothetical protein
MLGIRIDRAANTFIIVIVLVIVIDNKKSASPKAGAFFIV